MVIFSQCFDSLARLMDYSVYKELSGWSHSKSYQWFNVQVKISNKNVSQGSVLFEIFVGDMDSGSKYTLRKFRDDTRCDESLSNLI